MLSPAEETVPSVTQALARLDQDEQLFVLELFRNGGKLGPAYRRVKPDVTRDSAYVLGSRLFRKPHVQAALDALRADLKRAVPIEVEGLAQRLRAQALGDLTDVASWSEPVVGPDGKDLGMRTGLNLRPSSELTPEEAALIDEVSIEPTQHGTKRRIKLVNRVAAARLLLELRGELKQVHKHEGEVTHRVMALPATQPSRDDWVRQYGPKQVSATVVSAEANER